MTATIYCFSSFFYILYLLKIRREGLSPVLFWIIFQMIMFCGLVNLADYDTFPDKMLLFIHFIGLYSFIGGNALHRIQHRKINLSHVELCHFNESSLFQVKCAVIICLSFIACIYLYSQSTNVINILITSIFKGSGIVSIERARYAFTQVSGNGYIYQFRVVLLPLINMFFLLSMEKKYKLLGYVLAPITAYFVLGTGQRGAAVELFVIFCVNIILLKNLSNYKTPKIFYIVTAFGIIMFALLTIANGRTQISGNLLLATLDRIFKDNQFTAIIGFRYIYQQPLSWGYDWFMRLISLLPGNNSYLALDSIINSIIYGGYGGTCPPSFIGSVYYNWGGVGTCLFLIFWGYFYQHITFLFYKRERVAPFDVTCYSFIVIKLGCWIAGDISGFFNNGTFAVLCLQLYMNMFNKKV